MAKSNDKTVLFESIPGQVASVYTCEVIADAPSFNAVTDEKELKLD